MNSKENLSYEEIYPVEDLGAYIKYFWHSKPATDTIYTVLPDGYFDLIIQFEDNRMKSIELFGLYTKEIAIRVPAGTCFWAVTFKPLAAEYILHQSIAHLLNQKQALPCDFWSIDQIPDFHQFVGRLTKKIRDLLTAGKEPDARKQKLFKLIFNSAGTMQVQNLSDQVFWTVRQINRYFNDRLGLSLKAYNNILRCAAAYPDLRDGDLFPGQEYYDQSHFIKEVKKHTGKNPSELHLNKNEQILQFITLPE